METGYTINSLPQHRRLMSRSKVVRKNVGFSETSGGCWSALPDIEPVVYHNNISTMFCLLVISDQED